MMGVQFSLVVVPTFAQHSVHADQKAVGQLSSHRHHTDRCADIGPMLSQHWSATYAA